MRASPFTEARKHGACSRTPLTHGDTCIIEPLRNQQVNWPYGLTGIQERCPCSARIAAIGAANHRQHLRYSVSMDWVEWFPAGPPQDLATRDFEECAEFLPR